MKTIAKGNPARFLLICLLLALAVSCADDDSDGDGNGNGQADCDDFYITEQAELENIKHCFEVDELSLHDGDFTEVSLPNLQSAGWINIGHNPDLTSLELPALTNVDDEFTIADNPALVELDLSSLEETYNGLSIAGTAIEILELPALTSIGYVIEVSGNDDLTEIVADELPHAWDLKLVANTSLTSMSFASLTSVDGGLLIDSCHALTSLADLAGLTTVSVSGQSFLDFNGLMITNNAGLTSLGLSGLTAIDGELRVQDNAALPTCEATDLRDAISLDGMVCISGNAPDTCEDDVSAECEPEE
jgi:hypothetical protein